MKAKLKKTSKNQHHVFITTSKAKDFVTAIKTAIEAIKTSARRSIRTANKATAITKRRTASTNRILAISESSISAISNAVDQATVIFI